MEKITKAQAKVIIKKKGEIKVWLYPSKAYPNPNHPFNLGILYDSSKYTFSRFHERISHFERFINEFKYYNCGAETGLNVHYYIDCI